MKAPESTVIQLDCGHGCTPIHVRVPIKVTSSTNPATVELALSDRAVRMVRLAARAHMLAVHL